MNYVQLRAVIQTYALNYEDTFVANIDNFIRLAESRILLTVRLPKFRKDISDALIAGEQLWTVPLDFLAPDSLAIVTDDGLVFVINKDPEFLDECYPDPTVRGAPRFYSYLNETSLKLGPTPDWDYPMNLGYFFQPASIVETGHNWLGDHFAHSLVSGALLEAALYMKAEDSLYARQLQAFQSDLQIDQQHTKGRTKKDTVQEPDQRVHV